MRYTFCLLLGLLPLAGPASAQAPGSASAQLLGSGSAQLFGFAPRPDSGRLLAVLPLGTLRAMSPDRTPCLFTDPAKVEQMPINRAVNKDQMPNSYFERPRVWVSRPRPK